MIIYVCTDDSMGMMFGGKRQSRDKILIDDVTATANQPIYIDKYSEILFKGTNADYKISDNLLEEAKDGDCCFIENKALRTFSDKIEKIILYRWNRKYPADFFFDIDLASSKFRRVTSIEFAGFSHDRITREEWEHE